MLQLYDYFRSSAAYRVRLSLALKRLTAERHAVDLLHREALPAYRDEVNPQGLVPAIETAEHGLIVQSIAIIEYLDERFPELPLLPATLQSRAYVRAISQLIACDIHPLANLRVLRYLKRTLGHEQAVIDDWYRHWVTDGLERLECFVVGRKLFGRCLSATRQPWRIAC